MKKLAAVLLFVVVICGCGGSSSSSTTVTPPMLTFPAPTLPSVQVGTAYSTNLIAAGGTTPYTWSITSGSLPPGLTIGSSTGVISGTPTAVGTFTFTATVKDSSSTQETASNSLSIKVTPPPLAILTASLSGGVANAMYSTTLQASGGTPPYAWTVASGSTLPTGMSLSSSGDLSGTPTAAGPSSFTVTVTDSSSPVQTQSKMLGLTIAAAVSCGSGSESLLSGMYAFKVSGFNATGYAAIVGSITANGTGGITAGEADMNSSLGVQTGNIVTGSSSYSVGADHRGCATIATSFGTFTTHFALGAISSSVSTKGYIMEFDPASGSAFIGSGDIEQQTSSSFSAGLNGSFTHLFIGWDAALPGRIACAGVKTAVGSGTAGGTFTAAEQDCNVAGSMLNATAGTGTYSSIDANGRGTGISGTNSLTFYMVSGSKLFSLVTDANPIMSGEAHLEVAPTGGYTAASLIGKGVLYASGLNNATSSKVQIGITTADGVGTLTASIYENDGGTWATPTPNLITCAYTVGSNGRVTMSGVACGSTPPILYLRSGNIAYVLGTDSGVFAGTAMPQTLTGTITNATVAGTYYAGTKEVVSQSSSSKVGVSVLASGGVVNSTNDSTSLAGQSADLVSTDSFSLNANGTFTTGSSGTAIIGLAISSSEFVLINGSSGPYPTITVAGQ